MWGEETEHPPGKLRLSSAAEGHKLQEGEAHPETHVQVAGARNVVPKGNCQWATNGTRVSRGCDAQSHACMTEDRGQSRRTILLTNRGKLELGLRRFGRLR